MSDKLTRETIEAMRADFDVLCDMALAAPSSDRKEVIDVALESAREARETAIEECARVCDENADVFRLAANDPVNLTELRVECRYKAIAANRCAAAIRALAASETPHPYVR